MRIHRIALLPLAMMLFPNSGNAYQRDLRYSIQEFAFTKPSIYSETFTLSDRCDFDSTEYSFFDNPFEAYAVKYMDSLEGNGTILPFDLELTFDLANVLQLRTVSKSNGVWTVSVENPHNYMIEYVYNKKMCFESDASQWTNLVDVSYGWVPPNSYDYLSIKDGSLRRITYANNLQSNGCMQFYWSTVPWQ